MENESVAGKPLADKLVSELTVAEFQSVIVSSLCLVADYAAVRFVAEQHSPQKSPEPLNLQQRHEQRAAYDEALAEERRRNEQRRKALRDYSESFVHNVSGTICGVPQELEESFKSGYNAILVEYGQEPISEKDWEDMRRP
jgi:hypothetical protein